MIFAFYLGCGSNHVQINSDCVECEGGSSFLAVFYALLICCGVFYLIVLILLLCTKKKKKKELDESGVADGGSHLVGHSKILVMFGQLLSSMPEVLFAVPWPAEFISFVSIIGSIANMDLLAAFSIGKLLPLNLNLVLHIHGF